MAIAYKSQGAGVATETSGAALSPLCPATVDAGDILIAHVFWEGTTSTPNTPSGWTLLDGPRVIESTIARMWVFGKIADGSEDGAAIAFGNPAVTTQRAARIYSFSGRVGGTITDLVTQFAFLSHATDPQMPTVATQKAGALAVALVGQNDNNTAGNATGESGGDWVEAVAEFTANLTPGLMLQIQTCTPTGNPGTVSGGSVATTNDPCGVIGFQIQDNTVQTVSPNGIATGEAHGSTKINLKIDLAPIIKSDDFNRANGGLGSSWDTDNISVDLTISSNQVQPSAVDEFCHARSLHMSYPADQFSQCTVKTPASITDAGSTSAAGAGPSVRGDGSGDYYKLIVSVSRLRIMKADTDLGNYVQLAGKVFSAGADSVLRLEVEGTALRGYVNGVLELQATDATHSAGAPGLFGKAEAGDAASVAAMDDWSAGPLGAAAGGGIPSGEAHGTATITVGDPSGSIIPTGIASAEAHGSTKINLQVRPGSVASSEAHGATRLNQTVSPTGIPTAEAMGSPRINLTVSPTGIASTEAHGSAKINRVVSPDAIASGEQHGAIRINLNVSPGSVPTGETHGSTTITTAAGPITISPTGISSAEAHGAARINRVVSSSGIASLEAHGLARLNLQLRPGSIPTGEAHGSTKIILDQVISPTGIPSAEAHGSTRVQLRIVPLGIVSLEAHGLARLNLQLRPGAIASGEAHGLLTIRGNDQVLSPVGIPSEEAAGDVTISVGPPPGPPPILLTPRRGPPLVGNRLRERAAFRTMIRN